jgi:hypothetical protein
MMRFLPPPEYVDSDPHNGFNPNFFFVPDRTPSNKRPRTGISPDLNVAYDGTQPCEAAVRRIAIVAAVNRPAGPNAHNVFRCMS